MKYKILLPVDFSDNSWNGVKYALDLYKNEDCVFYLLNVYLPTIYNMDYMMSSDNVYNVGEVSKRGLKDLKERILSEFNDPKHSIKTISSFNSLIPEIQDLVNEKEIDLIIMGTKGATGATQILFGSNTIHVLKNAKCSLLAIPDNYEFKTIKNMLFPSDFEINYALNQINSILEIVRLNNSKLNVLNVSHNYELSKKQKENKLGLETYFNKVETEFHSVADKDLEEAINEFQLKHKIDLLVMINNKHSFFERKIFKSVINQIGFHLNIPFLVIPTKK